MFIEKTLTTNTRLTGDRDCSLLDKKGVSLLSNVLFIDDYKEKKEKRIRNIQDAVHKLYMNEIVESFYVLQETEDILWEIEKKHGSEILKNTWNSLSEEEQKELLYMLNALVKKISYIGVKTTSFDKDNKPPF